jgi:predicted ATPase/DNA-binding CsgD family transcriptional regulator
MVSSDSILNGQEERRPIALVSLTRPPRLAPPPRSLTPLIGRASELAQTIALLQRPGVRLISLIGPAGVGKTRLAIEAARSLDGALAGAIGFVSFAAVKDPALVLSTIAQAADLRDAGSQPVAEMLAGTLAHQNLLLICDNLESVVEAAPDLAWLLSSCPNLRILATSRSALRISGERVIPLSPLGLPDETGVDPAALAESAAVRLFVDRAKAARPDFALTRENSRAVAVICRGLDGLPLALELAAARTRILSPQAMVGRLSHRLALLSAGPRDLPPRHQTMRAAVSWSYDLLTPNEQALFRRLAVFAGGFTLEAAEAVCAGTGDRGQGSEERASSDPSLLDGIASLIDQSLVQAVDPADGQIDPDAPRFVMLETIREFGLERLAEAGEEGEVRRRHAAWMLDLAERAKPHLERAERGRWLARLDADHNNLRAALGWALSNEPDERALRFIAAVWRFWELNGYATEGRDWAERALARDRTAPPQLRAAVIYGAGFLAYRQGDFARSMALMEEALTIWRRFDDPAGLASALIVRGLAVQAIGDYPCAAALLEEALALRRAAGDVDAIATALNNLALAVCELGDLDRAWALHEEQLALERTIGDAADVAYALFGLASVAYRRGDLVRAAALHEEALALRRQVDGRGATIAWSLYGLAGVVADLGDASRAAALWQESLALRADHGERAGMADALTGLASIAVAHGDAEVGTRLLGAADALRDATGAAPSPIERTRRDRTLSAATCALGAERTMAALASGRATPLPDILDLVAQMKPRSAAAPSAPPLAPDRPDQPSLLSAREMAVLRLIAEGCSNREIADALSISPRTVMVHVTNILGKLDVPSRAAAAAYAHQHGLLAPG